MTPLPLAIDLFTGCHGWAEGLVSEGWKVVGFDLEDMSGQFGLPKPNNFQLVIQDVLTLHGKQFKDASLIVASPPCQAYSYRAMPWKRAKALPPPDNALFDACFRIQREAIEAAGHFIPMVVENVRGAEKWVGRARWHYGSYYLWGDVPALMPIPGRATKNHGGSWFAIAHNTQDGSGKSFQTASVEGVKGIPHSPTGHWTNPNENGQKVGGDGFFENGSPWMIARGGPGTNARKAASAMIAKIPFPLASYIAAYWRPRTDRAIMEASV